MAFLALGLKRITHVGAVGTGAGSVRSFWAYITEDDAAAVETSGYFNAFQAAGGDMRKGDVIMASLNVDATAALKFYLVSAVTQSAVTLAQLTTPS